MSRDAHGRPLCRHERHYRCDAWWCTYRWPVLVHALGVLVAAVLWLVIPAGGRAYEQPASPRPDACENGGYGCVTFGNP